MALEADPGDVFLRRSFGEILLGVRRSDRYETDCGDLQGPAHGIANSTTGYYNDGGFPMLTCRRLLAVGFLFATMVSAQRYTSPPAKASVKIAGKQITVDYYAPSMHGRKIFGSLVPWYKVWCPGANVATGLTTEAPLQLGSLKLPKGTWSIWAIPGEKDWTLIVNKQSGQHHLDYDPAEDFGRTTMTLKMLSQPAETFRIEVSPSGGNEGTLAF